MHSFVEEGGMTGNRTLPLVNGIIKCIVLFEFLCVCALVLLSCEECYEFKAVRASSISSLNSDEG